MHRDTRERHHLNDNLRRSRRSPPTDTRETGYGQASSSVLSPARHGKGVKGEDFLTIIFLKLRFLRENQCGTSSTGRRPNSRSCCSTEILVNKSAATDGSSRSRTGSRSSRFSWREKRSKLVARRGRHLDGNVTGFI